MVVAIRRSLRDSYLVWLLITSWVIDVHQNSSLSFVNNFLSTFKPIIDIGDIKIFKKVISLGSYM